MLKLKNLKGLHFIYATNDHLGNGFNHNVKTLANLVVRL